MKLVKKTQNNWTSTIIIVVSTFLLIHFIMILRLFETLTYNSGGFSEIFYDFLFIESVSLIYSFIPFLLLPLASIILFSRYSLEQIAKYSLFASLITYLFSVIIIKLNTVSNVSLSAILLAPIPIIIFNYAVLMFCTIITLKTFEVKKAYGLILPLSLVFLVLIFGILFSQ